MTLLLYGVVRTNDWSRHSSEHDVDAVSIESDDIAVVASALPEGEDEMLSEQEAIDYLDVLTDLVQLGPVLPLRYGTEAPDEEAVRHEVLDPEVERFRETLNLIEAMIEVRIDLTFDESTGVRAVLDRHPTLRDDSARILAESGNLDEKVELGKAVTERYLEWCQERAEDALAGLDELALRKYRLEPPREGIERSAWLTQRDRLQDFDSAVRSIRHELEGVAQVTYIGPLPLFDFLDTVVAEHQAEQSTSRWGW